MNKTTNWAFLDTTMLNDNKIKKNIRSVCVFARLISDACKKKKKRNS